MGPGEILSTVTAFVISHSLSVCAGLFLCYLLGNKYGDPYRTYQTLFSPLLQGFGGYGTFGGDLDISLRSGCTSSMDLW